MEPLPAGLLLCPVGGDLRWLLPVSSQRLAGSRFFYATLELWLSAL